MNLRPSNILKNIEDGVAFAVGSVGRKARKFGHDVRVEFRARQIAAETKRMNAITRKLDELGPEEAIALARDQAEIMGRAAQIVRGRVR